MEAVELQLQREIERLQMEDVDANPIQTQTSVVVMNNAPALQYLQSSSVSSNQPQYIGQQAQAMHIARTMSESVSKLEQKPPQLSNFDPGDKGSYLHASQAQTASTSTGISSSYYNIHKANLSTVSMPSQSALVSQQPTQSVQVQQTSERQPATSVSQQRPLLNGASYNHFQLFHGSVPTTNTSKPRQNYDMDYQKPVTLVEDPSIRAESRHQETIPPAPSLSHSGQIQMAGSMQQETSVTNNVIRQFHSRLHNPSQQAWTSELVKTSQTSIDVMSGSLSSTVQGSSNLPTVYGMPANLVRKNAASFTTSALSPIPLTSAFASGSPVQPAIKSTVATKSAAVIQTPLPVKPQHHIKHKVMKQYTPAVPSMQHTIVDIPVPIQTPMAMRNLTQQGQKPGTTGRLVSPIPQIATQPTRRNESQLQEYSDQFNPHTATLEPKLKLDFDGVEDTPSGEVRSTVPAFSVSTSLGQGFRTVGQSFDCQTSGLKLKGWNKSLAGEFTLIITSTIFHAKFLHPKV